MAADSRRGPGAARLQHLSTVEKLPQLGEKAFKGLRRLHLFACRKTIFIVPKVPNQRRTLGACYLVKETANVPRAELQIIFRQTLGTGRGFGLGARLDHWEQAGRGAAETQMRDRPSKKAN